MQPNKLAFIIPTMNPQVLSDLFQSLLAQLDSTTIAICVGIEVAPEQIEALTDPAITWIHTANRGYAYAVNRGIERAQKEGATQFCVMNDDTFVAREFVTQVRRQLNTHPHCIIGGKIYYAPHFEYHKERYTEDDLGTVLWYAGGIVDRAHAMTTHRGVDEVDQGQYNIPQTTEFVTGCLIAFDASVISTIGMWDESYFLYYEDADYCERGKRHGIQIWYCPEIQLWHKVSQSTGGSGSRIHVKFQRQNRIKWSLKYMPLRTSLHLIKQYILDVLPKVR
jgi:GT2 family glycosyltransferase